MPRGHRFEADVTFAFNRFFEENDIQALAWRVEQATRFSAQPCDLVLDSLDRQYYVAIECKSMLLKKQKSLYFHRHFSLKGESQLDRMTEFCKKSGRKGYLAVELRGHPRSAYLINFGIVYDFYRTGDPGVPVDVIRGGIPLRRANNQWFLESF